jgi:aspartyl-tRNA(Asn)/glutamyl-tRNA(Gln) amidotransferase subunit C
MPSPLAPAEVDHIAKLAHLALTDEERTHFAQQLADILAYARQVQDVDTAGVPPTAHALVPHDAMRADEPRPSLPRDEALAAAPGAAPEAGFFRVPRVIGG